MRNTMILSLRMMAFSFFICLSSCIGPFNESDAGKSIALPVGTPFEIRLEADPDSDFTWRLANIDTTVVKMVFQPEFKPYNEPEKNGGVTSYYFQTTGEGTTAIRMVYENENEPEAEPEKSYELVIDCRI